MRRAVGALTCGVVAAAALVFGPVVQAQAAESGRFVSMSPAGLPRGSTATVRAECAPPECGDERNQPTMRVSGVGVTVLRSYTRAKVGCLNCGPAYEVAYFDVRIDPGAPVGTRDVRATWANGDVRMCIACFGVLPTHTTFRAFPVGAEVTTLDVDGDSEHEIAVGAGPGHAPEVRIYRVSRRTGTVGLLSRFLAFEPGFRGGVHVSGGQAGELVVGAGRGHAPVVKLFGVSATGAARLKTSFLAYAPGFGGGVTVALIPNRRWYVRGQPLGWIMTGTGPGGGPHVRIWRRRATGGAEEVVGFLAFGAAFRGGVNVSAAPLSWKDEIQQWIAVGVGPGAAPMVRELVLNVENRTARSVRLFSAYSNDFRGGVVPFFAEPAIEGVGWPPGRMFTSTASAARAHVREFHRTAARDWQLHDEYLLYSPAVAGGAWITLRPGGGGEDVIGVPHTGHAADVRIRWSRGHLRT